MSAPTVTLTLEDAELIRSALLIGLDACACNEKARNDYDFAESTGHPWPKDARPTIAGDGPVTVSEFAAALNAIRLAQAYAREADHA